MFRRCPPFSLVSFSLGFLLSLPLLVLQQTLNGDALLQQVQQQVLQQQRVQQQVQQDVQQEVQQQVQQTQQTSSPAAGPCTTQTRQKSLRTAFYSILVKTPDHYKSGDLVLSALLLKCSAQCLRSELPWYLIYAGGGRDDTEDLKLLEQFGWSILDHSRHYNLVKSIYKPVYLENDTSTQRDMRILRSNARRQPRTDGWATYFKFYAWRAAGLDRIVLMDVDSFFIENPDPLIRAVPQDVPFMATAENHNWMRGTNSHMMIIRPSNETFNELVYRAKEGEYIPFTNGEQDVVEAVFPPRLEHKNKLDMRRLFPHVHYRLVPLYRPRKGWPPRSCDDVFRISNMSAHAEYGLQWQQMEERCSLRGRSS